MEADPIAFRKAETTASHTALASTTCKSADKGMALWTAAKKNMVHRAYP
jgi:hypothetical protein